MCLKSNTAGTAAYGTYKVTAMVDKSDETKKYVISSATGNSREFVELFELDLLKLLHKQLTLNQMIKRHSKLLLKLL